jgi:hypothetical protein
MHDWYRLSSCNSYCTHITANEQVLSWDSKTLQFINSYCIKLKIENVNVSIECKQDIKNLLEIRKI